MFVASKGARRCPGRLARRASTSHQRGSALSTGPVAGWEPGLCWPRSTFMPGVRAGGCWRPAIESRTGTLSVEEKALNSDRTKGTGSMFATTAGVSHHPIERETSYRSWLPAPAVRLCLWNAGEGQSGRRWLRSTSFGEDNWVPHGFISRARQVRLLPSPPMFVAGGRRQKGRPSELAAVSSPGLATPCRTVVHVYGWGEKPNHICRQPRSTYRAGQGSRRWAAKPSDTRGSWHSLAGGTWKGSHVQFERVPHSTRSPRRQGPRAPGHPRPGATCSPQTTTTTTTQRTQS